MKNWWKRLTAEAPWVGDFLLCLGGLGIGATLLYTELAGEEVSLKPTLCGILSLLMAGGCGIVVVRDICRWMQEKRRDLSPATMPLLLTAEQLRTRMQRMQEALAGMEDAAITIEVSDKKARWIDDVVMDAHLLKQNWCAALSLPAGGILLPSQLRRISENATVKLPARFLSSQLTSCIICCDKGQLSIYPATCAPTLQRELIPGLLSESEQEFTTWLTDYRERVTEEMEDE